MQIDVGPARRPGSIVSIYDEPLRNCDIAIETTGEIVLTVDARGMSCERSRYRYRLKFSSAEAERLLATLKTRARRSRINDPSSGQAKVLLSSKERPKS